MMLRKGGSVGDIFYIFKLCLEEKRWQKRGNRSNGLLEGTKAKQRKAMNTNKNKGKMNVSSALLGSAFAI